ncbi:ABC transporter ATP-binding protein [Pelagicoccus sp. SDUM812003]|nr:ABC transporter ATP-binding protein [Pelagicoccus sp. SDUM812003]
MFGRREVGFALDREVLSGKLVDMEESSVATAALRFVGVNKRYGDFLALKDVDLTVEPGEIFALLGPNGAGKTTAIGCASGLIQDFEGRIEVGGYDVRSDFRITRRLVGLVPQELNFDGFFSAREALFYQSGYYGQRPDKKKIEQMLRSFALHEKADTNTRRLSGGMKRRLMVCKALMHDPAVLFLDEPTAGVDVELREELWENVSKLKEDGVTIVLTTHYLEEAEQLADRIGIIDQGKLLRVQPREELLSELGRRWVRVSFSGPVSLDTMLAANLGRVTQEDGHRFRIDYEPSENDGSEEHLVGRLVDFGRARGLLVVDVQAGRSSLEDIFKDLLKNGKKEAGR